MTEVEHSNELIVPATGQIVDLHNPLQVAQVLDDLRQVEMQVRDAKRVLVEALQVESTRLGTRTLELGDYVVELTADSKPEWDLELLRELLTEAGLPEERIDALIVAEVKYKLNQSVARQLKGANPDYAAALDRSRSEVPATVYAKVRRGR